MAVPLLPPPTSAQTWASGAGAEHLGNPPRAQAQGGPALSCAQEKGSRWHRPGETEAGIGSWVEGLLVLHEGNP